MKRFTILLAAGLGLVAMGAGGPQNAKPDSDGFVSLFDEHPVILPA